MLVLEAESAARVRELLGADPWSEELLRVESFERWTVRLDGRPDRSRAIGSADDRG